MKIMKHGIWPRLLVVSVTSLVVACTSPTNPQQKSEDPEKEPDDGDDTALLAPSPDRAPAPRGLQLLHRHGKLG